MTRQHLELRTPQDIGGLISVFFDFLKKNIKSFFNVFISYNGIFILAFLGISYVLMTGFLGLVGSNAIPAEEDKYLLIAGAGFFSLFFVYLITTILNHSLAASYMVLYVRGNKEEIHKKEVWLYAKESLGRIVLFIILMTLLYMGVVFLSFVLAFIPVLGIFVQYFIVLGYTGWIGLSFMALMDRRLDVTEAFSQGWNLLTKNFWKVILTNLVITLLLGILFMALMFLPGIIIGVFMFHAIDSSSTAYSVFPVIIGTISMAVVLVFYTFYQALTQFVNGVIYYSVYEEMYNEAALERIDSIGSDE